MLSKALVISSINAKALFSLSQAAYIFSTKKCIVYFINIFLFSSK